ncbi:MAG: peptidoglycan-binding protein [Fibrobacteria bacterium]|nr:peptidoglycan-binding protein [Fibrobacteria bacterium]
MNSPYPNSSLGESSPFDGPSLLDRYKGKPSGDIRFPTASAPQRPAVDPDYLAKTRENDPWPEGSSCAPPSEKPSSPTPSVVLSNCRFLTPPDQLRLNEPFEMAVDVRRIAPGKVRRAFFDLHQSWIRDGVPEEQSIVRGIEGFPDSDGTTHTIKAKEALEIAVPYVPGETVDFWLTATHLEASEPATSPRIQVALKVHAHWLGGGDLQFGLDGEFPFLGSDGGLARILATALRRTAHPPDPAHPETTICFGFASASGSPEHNRKLSLRRARVVKAILDRDEPSWEDLAKENFRTEDLQQFLSDLSIFADLPCDPGPVDGRDGSRTQRAVKAFQGHANAAWKLGLQEDGICGPRTWNAILRQILSLIQKELGNDASSTPDWKTPSWGHDGKGVYGNGEDFASAEENPDERSVQIMYFAPGNDPSLIDPPENTKVTSKENPVEDASRVAKEKIPTEGPTKPGTPPTSPASPPGSIGTPSISVKFLSSSAYCGDTIKIEIAGENLPEKPATKIDLKSVHDGSLVESLTDTLDSLPHKTKWIVKKKGTEWAMPDILVAAEAGGTSATGGTNFKIKRLPDYAKDTKTIACASGIFGWTGKFDIEFKGGILHVTTKIKLVNRLGAKPAAGSPLPAIGPAVTDADKAAMKKDIESKLTGKWFMHREKCDRNKRCDCDARNGCCKFRVRVHTEFVESGEHHVVNLFQGAGRANASNWTRVKTRDNSWAHETGHLLGWYDEYAGGAVGTAPRWKTPNSTAVMSSGLSVPFEYYWDFRDWLKGKTTQDWEGTR